MDNNGITIADAHVLSVAKEKIKIIEPIVKMHGGGVEVLKATTDQLVIGISGHCAGCPMAPINYGKILNKYLQEALPELKTIEYKEM